MKILKVFFMGAALALTMACGTDNNQQAQDDRQVLDRQNQQRDQQTDRPMSSRDVDQGLASGRSSSAVSMDHLIGSTVRTRDGNEEVGTLEDILTDSTGKPLAAVISMSEFLGIGEKQVAVDWEQITVVPENENQSGQSDNYGNERGTMDEFHETDGFVVLVNMTEQTLKNAPDFQRTRD